MTSSYCSILQSPIGAIYIFTDEAAVNRITFKESGSQGLSENKISQLAATQLNDYFEGNLTAFNLPLKQQGTEFQQGVWTALQTIAYGNTCSYLEFSKQQNNVLAIRAIAAANGKNKLAIVIPCHRVIGSNGKLVGYAEEVWRKKWLLDHERAISKKGQMTLNF
ncbi:methylated-DNA--[protein]-cysteine S-methyltransferase [Pedobacter gandavensis]|uniref:Methylated-DNA--[protein]-cysteine S-methyltransferase n=1 Tax=Pedobacter gandavensis TaxID=2679963 RepID=A0ABR6F1S7_9SPHI|nr:methylated-DNA--[protein]-cysteine S-methyltransferase [Pedobacter gandavensis]MBB2151493.1 methylated-DNA--[protein]-cysteine S-methyltransferase [Pedobacter gandavensis]